MSAAPRIALTVEGDARERVDRYLASRTMLSRSAIKRLLDEGLVTVDGRAVEAAHRVRAGEAIEVEVREAALPAELVAEDIPVPVVYEDDDVIVVNKPAGLVVHPAVGHASGTLVNAILAHVRTTTGRAERRPGIVHRLDKDTSGVLVVAKNDTAHLALARQLQGKRFEKEYLALVWGDPGARPGVIEAPLRRDAKDRRRVAVETGGREATTRFSRIAAWHRKPDLALLLVRPITGRTHQIRAHLAFAGYPVVGDPVYGRRGDATGLRRQFLHAWRLTLRLPHAGERTFTAPLPEDLRAVLASLGTPDVTAPPYGELAA
ncbi:MAG TPA: RluA family pseudouridine synthase [Candidatus Dormibacteraeota bacterium]|nr:RluA family pseudouridine synthase [Candidatus Dormibacteraeota bacterium]